MNVAHVPEPGSYLGPCIGTCPHPGRKALRQEAETRCSFCDQVIGYGRDYLILDGHPQHHHCQPPQRDDLAEVFDRT